MDTRVQEVVNFTNNLLKGGLE